jgi:CBS domain-containing protein
MALAFPQVLGVGYDTIEALLGVDGGIPVLALLLLLGAKLLATGISNASGFVGGGFAPALVLGAVLGNCYGQLLGSGGLQLPVAEPPAYAMVGMAAVLAGSARAPLTALLLLFELTRDIRIVLPLMAAAGLSAALVERWQGLSDPGLLGPDITEERRRRQLAAVPVGDALEPEAPLVLPRELPAIAALEQLVAAQGHCLLVSEGDQVVGLVTLPDLQRALTAASDEDTLANSPNPPPLALGECQRSELVWLPGGPVAAKRPAPAAHLRTGNGVGAAGGPATPGPAPREPAGRGQPGWAGQGTGLPADSFTDGSPGRRSAGLIHLNRGEVAGLEGAGHRIGLLEPLHDPLQIEGRQLAIAAPLEHGAGHHSGVGTTRVA